MRRELVSIIFFALVSIFMLFIDADANTIVNIIVLSVVTALDCIYIYITHHIDIERRSEKLKNVYITGVALMVVSALLAVIEGIVLVNELGIFGSLSRIFGGKYSYCWEFILSAVLIYQIYKTMKSFSNSLESNDKTEWFYKNEDNQEEK